MNAPHPLMARLKREREARGLTQYDVADRAGLGQSTVSGWETGERHPTLPLLDDYLAALEMRLEAVQEKTVGELLAEVIEALAGLFTTGPDKRSTGEAT